MKTFDELKQRITPEFIMKLCELAEGFSYNGNKEFILNENSYHVMSDAFSILLHRAAEGWNNKNNGQIYRCKYNDLIDYIYYESEDNKYNIDNYKSCHLTACEMAILDCLLEVLK
jgi:hypothetical protein